MTTLISIVIFPIVLSYLISHFTKQNLATLLPISIFISVIWLFIFGILDLLDFGAKVFIPLLISIFVICSVFVKGFITKEKIYSVFSPAIAIFVVVSVWTFEHSQHMRFKEWDEFAGWGPAVKSLFLFGKVGPYSPYKLIFPEYPPGLSLFEYFVVKIGNAWDEADVYWAYQVIVISLIVSILGNLTWKRKSTIVFAFMISAISAVFYYGAFQTIYGDPLLGLIFGLTLVIAASSEIKSNRWLILNFSIAVTMLSITKDIGIFLGAISALVLLLNLLLTDSNPKRKLLSKTGVAAGLTFLAFAPTLFAKVGWSYAIKKGGLELNRDFFAILKDFISGNFANLKQPYWDDVISNFRLKTTSQSLTGMNGYPISATKWIFIFTVILLITLFALRNKKEIIRLGTIYAVIIAGFFAYLFILLFLYLTTFSQGEAVGLASYDRYVSAYFAGLAFFTCYLALLKFENFSVNNSESAITIIWIMLLLIQSSPWNLMSYLAAPNAASDQIRSQYDVQRSMIKDMNFTIDNNVWFIAEHTVGFEFYMFQYELMPANIGRSPWSIGTGYGPGDIWTDSSITPEVWDSKLNTFDFVFVHSVTDSFVKEFGNMFEDPNSLKETGIYKIDHRSNGNILIKVR